MMANYRKWLWCTGLTVVVISLLHVILVYYFYQGQSHEVVWIHNTLAKKESIARGVRGPKIVFSGGSATHFGVRTKDVQEKLGIPSVNLGLHAAIQLDYLLSRLQKILHPGDVVILALENEYLTYNGEVNDRTADYLVTYDKAFFQTLPLATKIKNLSLVSPIRLAEAIGTTLLFGETRERPDRGYNSSTLNENGDETCNVGKEKIDKIVASPRKIQTEEFTETMGLKKLKEFNAWGLKHNVAVYVTFANTLSCQEYYTSNYSNYFNAIKNYFKENNIAAIGTPYDFFYGKELFYDTEHHLNQEGVTIRTKQLIEMLISLGIADRIKKSATCRSDYSHQ